MVFPVALRTLTRKAVMLP